MTYYFWLGKDAEKFHEELREYMALFSGDFS